MFGHLLWNSHEFAFQIPPGPSDFLVGREQADPRRVDNSVASGDLSPMSKNRQERAAVDKKSASGFRSPSLKPPICFHLVVPSLSLHPAKILRQFFDVPGHSWLPSQP